MIVRFGYVAMSVHVKNSSPSKTMTAKQFNSISDREAAIRKLERIARENLENTIRLLQYNKWEHIHLYRFSSRLIPLVDYEGVEDWDYFSPIEDLLEKIGEIVVENKMRVGFHPEHFTILNSTNQKVVQQSIQVIQRHVELLKRMKLTTRHRNVLHVGSHAGGKDIAIQRFIDHFPLLSKESQETLLLENDDKTFTVEETLGICEELGIPMVLDLHHDRCNSSSQKVIEYWPRILQTWGESNFPPKIHISSPKDEKDIRAHADYVELADFLPFLQEIKSITPSLDVMIEAKQKDDALLDIMGKIVNENGIEKVDSSTIEII